MLFKYTSMCCTDDVGDDPESPDKLYEFTIFIDFADIVVTPDMRRTFHAFLFYQLNDILSGTGYFVDYGGPLILRKDAGHIVECNKPEEPHLKIHRSIHTKKLTCEPTNRSDVNITKYKGYALSLLKGKFLVE